MNQEFELGDMNSGNQQQNSSPQKEEKFSFEEMKASLLEARSQSSQQSAPVSSVSGYNFFEQQPQNQQIPQNPPQDEEKKIILGNEDKKEIGPNQIALQISKRLKMDNFKNDHLKNCAQARLDNIKKSLTEDEISEIEQQARDFVPKQNANNNNGNNHQDKDFVNIATRTSIRLRFKAEKLSQDQKDKIEKRFQFANEKLSDEDKKKVEEAIATFEQKIAEKNSKKEASLPQKYARLWRRINNGKANDKQKDRFEFVKSKMNNQQMNVAQNIIDGMKVRLQENEERKLKKVKHQQFDQNISVAQ